MKYLILFTILLLLVSCSTPSIKEGYSTYDEISIPLSDQERFLSLYYSIGDIGDETVIASFNSINGDLKVSDLITGKEFFRRNIPLDGPNSIPEHFLLNVNIGDQRIALTSNAGKLIYLFDINGELIDKIHLLDNEDDHEYFYASDGNALFFHNKNKIYLNYFADLFPNRDPGKDYYSILSISSGDKTFSHLAPVPKENIEKIWGEGHMIVGPYGTYSKHYEAFLTGFANSNVVKIYDIEGGLLKEVELDLKNWKKPLPTDIKFEDSGSLSQEAIYELRGYSGSFQKVWKILEMKDGFLVEVLQPVSEAPLPRFSVYKFDLDFNFLSTHDFFDDHFTCYQSFIYKDKYHLVDLKAYQEDEDKLVFGAISFDDL